MEKLLGNLVLPDVVCYGELMVADGMIGEIVRLGEFRLGQPLILPGFIDLHFHGLGPFGTESLDSLRGIAEFAPSTGTTGVCPAMSAEPWENLLNFVKNGAVLAKSKPAGAHFLGTHLEGPYIYPPAKGGMNGNFLRAASVSELDTLLAASDGTLRVLTLSPEIPGAFDLIRLASSHGVQVSIGHTRCTPELFAKAVGAGAAQVCHLFDTFEGRQTQNGVSQVSLTDAILIDDRVFVEVIVDGQHVPPALIELTRRCAGIERIIAITDCMQGTGLPDAVYREGNGREFRLTNGDVCRLTDESQAIVGSCLTMDQAFRNLTGKFSFSVGDASRVLSANPARALKIADHTGQLKTGLQADIVILTAETHQVATCIVAGKTAFQKHSHPAK